MTVFDRITHDPSVASGQARIRETQITATEIARRALAGESQAAILDIYPMLEAEDIHQAIAYSVQDLLQCVSYWRHEGLNPLQQIRGYSDLLTGRSSGIDPTELDEAEKQSWLNIIRDASYRGAACWHHLGNRVYSYYRDDAPTLAPEPLSAFLRTVKEESSRAEPELRLKLTVPELPTMLRSSPRLATAVASLLTAGKNTFKPRAQISIQVNDNQADFVIRRSLQYRGDHIHHLVSSPAAITTARLLLHLHGSQLSIQQRAAYVTFSFSIPLASH